MSLGKERSSWGSGHGRERGEKGAGRRRREVVGRAVIFVGEIFLGRGS